jgi:hypothetical protein
MTHPAAWRRGRRALIATLFFSATTAVVTGQSPWTYYQGVAPVVGTPDAFFTVESPATCSDSSQTLPNEGYLKGGTFLTTDVANQNEGTCRNYLYGNPHSVSDYGIVEIFAFLHIPGYEPLLGPTHFQSIGWPWSFYGYPLWYDTRSPANQGESGPLPFKAGTFQRAAGSVSIHHRFRRTLTS